MSSAASSAVPATSRRWARVALVAATGMLAALVWLLVQNAVALLIAVALVAVGATAAWQAVRTSGMERRLWAAIAALAAVALAVDLVRRGAVGELILFAISLAVFSSVTRRALTPPAVAPAPPPDDAQRVRRPARGILLLNPKSGGGKVERFGLVEEARRRGIETVMLQPGDDLRALAEDAAARAPRAIGMAGGDGSQALVADVAVAHGIPYVCIAAGTRNHLALDLGLDLEDVASGLDAFVDGTPRRVDLAYANDRVFVNNTSIGVYADIVQSSAYRNAKLKTALAEMPGLLAPGADGHVVSFAERDGGVGTVGVALLVSNNPYELRRPLAAGARLRLDTGLLGVAAIDAAPTLTLRQWTTETFEVWSDDPITAGIDGEALVLEDRIRFRSAPGALAILLPPNADLTRGLRLQRPTALIRTLARVAAGREDALVS